MSIFDNRPIVVFEIASPADVDIAVQTLYERWIELEQTPMTQESNMIRRKMALRNVLLDMGAANDFDI